MPVSKLDSAYRGLVLSKFFKKGWGKPENLKKLFEFRKVVSKRETCYPLVDTDYPVTITKEINYSDSILLEGNFISPFEQYLPGLLPQVSETAYFQVLIPKKWQSSHFKPICLHLAGTGDHFFFRRRNLMAKPLLKEAGIGALLLENPFYGLRKPKDQRWSALHNVSDIFVMGGCLILESLVLFHWCKRNGFGPFGLTGISMGGHMASLAATNIPEPIVLVPCLSWTTASGVFTRGVLSSAIDWECLEEQYFTNGSYSNEIKQMVKIIDNVYLITHAENDVCDKLVFRSHRRPSFVLSPSTTKWQQLYPRTTYVFEVLNKSLSRAHGVKQTVAVLPKYRLGCGKQFEGDALLEQNALFAAGQHFAQNYPESLNHVQKLSTREMGSSVTEEKNSASSANMTKSNESQTSEGQSREQIAKNEKERLLEGLKQNEEVPDKKNNESTLEKAKNKMSDYLRWKTKENEKFKQAEGSSLDVKNNKIDREKHEALQFMCGIMDECTHLKNFSVPVDTELIISVTAEADGYVPRDGLTDLQELWQGSEVRYLKTGHISAYLLHQKFFRLAIIDAFEKLKLKYYKDEFSKQQVNEEQRKQ